ncbi:MAG: M23 family metallopeptidase, partial [Candidatus Pacebacteria bacterium]|nr:M23 family metallopeptidase [Candidatus Paceibacterota bacterium]
TAEFNNNDFEFYPINSDIEEIVVLPISAKAQIGKHPLTIKSNLRASFSTVIKVKGVNFKVTNLTVTNNLSQKGYNANSIQKNVANENELIYSKVLNEPVTQFLFTNKFVYPLDKVVNVGAYGNIRKSGNVSLQHLGVDLDAKERTSVYTINDGIVKFTREMNDYGKMMIIDHGGGIRSFYLHLNEFLKSEGESVKRGEAIAYSGNTGYSIEPHLHLSINVYGNSIDPLFFIEAINDSF